MAIEDTLKPIIEQYNQLHESRQLTVEETERHKNLCLDTLLTHMKTLDRNGEEYKECAFLSSALKNGWLVSDIVNLQSIYRGSQVGPAGEHKTQAEFYLRQISEVRMDKLLDRYELLRQTNKTLYNLWSQSNKKSEESKIIKSGYDSTRKLLERHILPVEYADDLDFARTAGTEELENGVNYYEISNDVIRFGNYLSVAEERRRTNQDYYIQEVEDALQAEAREKFEPGWAHTFFGGIKKKPSSVVREAFGDAVYDEIYEMTRGSTQERKVRLHHSRGTKFQKEGHDVLEMDFAGSGGQDVIRKHKERYGGIVLEGKTQEQILKDYGEKAPKPDGTGAFDYIWKKERTMDLQDGTSAQKVRYTFPGPTPGWRYFRGLPNIGEYSVQNSSDYARFYAEQFLEERFNQWLKDGTPKPVHIALSGHSRGAVTAGQAAVKINQWITDYINTHPGAEKFKDYVNYDLILRDPVPGIGTSLSVGDCDLRDVPNVNVTVFCSLGIQGPETVFPLQHIRGAKKLILNMEEHQMDVSETDNTQKSIVGNDNTGHMVSYYDSETGEMHRGSGLSDLPDGVYFADEKYRLIRVTSYSQMQELYHAALPKGSMQTDRTKTIHEMVRDWFCENELQMSFPDEQTRSAEANKNEFTQKSIMKSGSMRLEPIKREIEALRKLKQQNASTQELLQQNKNLIEACRTYMKGTSVPPKGENAYLMGLVGDTLSFTMRENNQLKKELNLVKDDDPQALLDAKIKAHKDRLDKKEGYLERKKALTEKRLGQEERIMSMMKSTKEKCETWLKTLDQTTSWKSNSSSYNKMHQMLEAGTKLSPRTSLNQMTDFLKRFTKVSGSYFDSHTSLIGPITFDGITRLNESGLMQEFGRNQLEQLKELSAGLGERNTPIGLQIMKHQDELSALERRQQEQTELNANPEKAPVNPEKAPANPEKAPVNPENRAGVKPVVQPEQVGPAVPSV